MVTFIYELTSLKFSWKTALNWACGSVLCIFLEIIIAGLLPFHFKLENVFVTIGLKNLGNGLPFITRLTIIGILMREHVVYYRFHSL